MLLKNQYQQIESILSWREKELFFDRKRARTYWMKASHASRIKSEVAI
ncbi:MAG: hypothetical protein QRY74_05070 [Chlamydia sp.]